MAVKKRSQIGTDSLVKLLLALFLLVILLLFFSGALDILKKAGGDETCRITVIAQSTAKLLGSSSISLSCPRHTLKLSETKAEIRTEKGSTLDKSRWETYITYPDKPLTENPESFYKVAADEMADCWYKMGEGNIDVFNKDIVNGKRATCMICSHISFERQGGALRLGSVSDFLEYLNTSMYTKHGKNIKYTDYLTKQYPAQWAGSFNPLYYYAADKSLYVYGFDESDKLSTSGNYVVFFKALKFSWVSDKLVGSTLASLSKKVAGTDEEEAFMRMDDTYYIFLAKPEDVPKVCGVIVN